MFLISCNKTGTNQEKCKWFVSHKTTVFFRWGHWTPEPLCILLFRVMGVLKLHLHVISNIALIDLHPNWIIFQQKRESALFASGPKVLSWLNVHQVLAQCWWSIMKAAEFFHSLWGGRKNWWLSNIMNSFWFAAAASILLADSQLCILGRASPNKGSTSSHKREYPEMASYKIHTTEYLFFSVVS